MADVKKTVEVIFGAVNNITDDLTVIGSGLKSFEDQVGSVTGPIADLTKSLLTAETVVLGLAAAYGGFAITKAIEFQNAQIDLQKVLSETDPKIESFTDNVIGLSEEYGVAASAILQGIANFKQAGFEAEQAAKLQKNALDLVIAGDVEAAQASEILVSILKGMNAEFNEAPRFVEALNNVSNVYATDLEQLATGMARLSPILNTMGFSFEEGTATITPIIEVFRSGSEAANALKTGLLSLISDAKPVTDALAGIGVSQFDLNGEMRSGKDIFNDVSLSLAKLNNNQKLVFAEQVFGKFQAAKLVQVFVDLEKVNKINAVAMAETGSVTEEVRLRLESAGKQVDRTRESFNNLAIVVGSQLLPGFGDANEGVQALLQAFRNIVSDSNSDLGKLFTEFAEEGKSFGDLLKEIAEVLPEAFSNLDLDNLIDSFGSLKGSINDLFGGLDLTRPEDLSLVLQELVDFITLLTNASAGAIRGLEPLIDGVISFLTTLADSDADTQNFIGNIGGLITILDTLLPSIGFIADALILIGGVKASASILDLGNAFNGIDIPGINLKLGKLAGLLGKAGLVGAAGAAGFALGTVLKEGIDIAVSSITGSETTLGVAIFDLFHSGDDATTPLNIKKIATEVSDIEVKFDNSTEAAKDYEQEVLDVASASVDVADSVRLAKIRLEELNITMDDSAFQTKFTKEEQKLWADEVEKFQGVMSQAANGLRSYSEQIKLNERNQKEVIGTFGDSAVEVQKLAGAIESAVTDNKSWSVEIVNGRKELTTWNNTLDDSVDANKDAANAIKETEKELEKLSDREKLAIEQTHAMEIVLEELASNERIAAMEFTASIKIAGLEADAKKVEAIMNTVASVFENTADIISSLVIGFDAAFTDSDRQFFMDLIKEQVELEKEALKITKDLTAAQIEKLNAETQALLQGVDVVISADGLEPEIEAFMFEILKRIQTKIVGDRAAFLLGSGITPQGA